MKRMYLVVLSFFCLFLLFACSGFQTSYRPTAIDSNYSRVYNCVYCEDDFNFQKEGELKGSFELSKCTDIDMLGLKVIIPKHFWGSPEYDSSWQTHVEIPLTLKFEWTKKDGSKAKVETVCSNQQNDTTNGCIGFDYVPLPCNKKIHYTLSFKPGTYCEGHPSFKGLEKIEGSDTVDKTSDIKEHPEKYPDFWKAKFLVVEGKRKGKFVGTHKKWAKD